MAWPIHGFQNILKFFLIGQGTIPAKAIKEVYDLIMLSGVKAVLNFAPFKMISTETVLVHNVDLTTELESLSYHLCLQESGFPIELAPET